MWRDRERPGSDPSPSTDTAALFILPGRRDPNPRGIQRLPQGCQARTALMLSWRWDGLGQDGKRSGRSLPHSGNSNAGSRWLPRARDCTGAEQRRMSQRIRAQWEARAQHGRGHAGTGTCRHGASRLPALHHPEQSLLQGTGGTEGKTWLSRLVAGRGRKCVNSRQCAWRGKGSATRPPGHGAVLHLPLALAGYQGPHPSLAASLRHPHFPPAHCCLLTSATLLIL